jgi:uncharacterized protein (DUF302 family)
MLPCNVVVQELSDGRVEIAAIDPVASTAAVDHAQLKQMAHRVGDLLRKIVADL